MRPKIPAPRERLARLEVSPRPQRAWCRLSEEGPANAPEHSPASAARGYATLMALLRRLSSPARGILGGVANRMFGCNLYGCGVVFKLSPGGTEAVLYSFCSLPSCSDGSGPFAGLIADRAGNLYGTTTYGGASGIGVVFKLSPSGTETVLHSFTGGGSGGLVADRAGNLYGTTGGGAAGKGVVFKLSGTGFVP